MFITPSPHAWDSFVRQHPQGHALQLSAFASLKQLAGWKSERIAFQRGDQIIAGAQLLFRPLPLRLGTMAYLPFGPLTAEGMDVNLLWEAIHTSAKKHHAAFLKWEPGFVEQAVDYGSLGFQPALQTIQPPRTVLIDIRGSEEDILGRMNQGTRRKIRQSLKNDIHYYEASRAQVKHFTHMMEATGERNAFGVHESSYYSLAYDLYVPQDAALILAEHQEVTNSEPTPLAGVFVLATGKTAWYLYGASANIKRNLMAAYGVQWKAIQWARERGCETYDMWGIPDEDLEQLEQHFETRSDGLWGVYGFKRGWGGKVARTAGAWDKVYQPLLYYAYKFALRLRNSPETE